MHTMPLMSIAVTAIDQVRVRVRVRYGIKCTETQRMSLGTSWPHMGAYQVLAAHDLLAWCMHVPTHQRFNPDFESKPACEPPSHPTACAFSTSRSQSTATESLSICLSMYRRTRHAAAWRKEVLWQHCRRRCVLHE